MSLPHLAAVLVAVLGILASSGLAVAADWDSCADDLDRLRRAARDASDKANEVRSAADDLESCRRYPANEYDRCASKASYYRSAVSDLESELSTVDSRIRSVNASCATALGGSASTRTLPQPSTGNRACDLYRSYLDKLPLESLVKACTKSMPEADCRKCLASGQ